MKKDLISVYFGCVIGSIAGISVGFAAGVAFALLFKQ